MEERVAALGAMLGASEGIKRGARADKLGSAGTGPSVPFDIEVRNKFGEYELVSPLFDADMPGEPSPFESAGQPWFPLQCPLPLEPAPSSFGLGTERPGFLGDAFPGLDKIDAKTLGPDASTICRRALCIGGPEDDQQGGSELQYVYKDPLSAQSVDMEVQESPINDTLLSSANFVRGRLGNTPFRPGGVDAEDGESSVGPGSQQPQASATRYRNAAFFTPDAIRQSLQPLINGPVQEHDWLRVPPGLDAHASELEQLTKEKDRSKSDEEKQSDLVERKLREENEWFESQQNTEKLAPQDTGERRRRMLELAESLLDDSDSDSNSVSDSDSDALDSGSCGLSPAFDLGGKDVAPVKNDFLEAIKAREREAEEVKRARIVNDPVLQIDALPEGDGDGTSVYQGNLLKFGVDAASEVDVAELERQLDEITTATGALVSQDIFEQAHKPGWVLPSSTTNLKLAQEDQEKWAITTPIDTSNYERVVHKPAMDFPFELDSFQKQAVMHMENGESVFIAAHTSAGKTVVAEYAIALSMQHRTRVVYTSPIKSLSNQKFSDFSKRFGVENVGLITGDVSINATASCLIMTTEILRSMLYRGADIVRDIEWVIFDEVHYINDLERGVVWEEVIIMLPAHVSMVFLSATTPNTVEFSSWIGRTKKRPVNVIYTEKRPVPLVHFIHTGTGPRGKMFQVLDAAKRFSKTGYDAAVRLLKEDEEGAEAKAKAKRGGAGALAGRASAKGAEQAKQRQQAQMAMSRRGNNEKTERAYWLDLIKSLSAKDLLPCVVFCFSKRMCNERAQAMPSLDLTTGKEKGLIHLVFARAMSRLQGSDRSLPQVLFVQDLVKRGLGVHHGGLLPILKEVVEVLFARGLIKTLFATESMAIGVNLPARSVVFHALRKHDGIQMRNLLPGEYTQMAGRAGRRGLDDVGTVIISISAAREPLPSDDLRKMLTGNATRLSSQFRLSYRMILNLLRVAELSVADMIKRSFSEFGTQRLIGGRDVATMIAKGEAKLKQLREKLGAQESNDINALRAIESCRREAQNLLEPLLAEIMRGAHGRKPAAIILKKGRVVLLSKPGKGFALVPACVLESPKSYKKSFKVLVLASEDAPTEIPAKCHDIVSVTNLLLCAGPSTPLEQSAEALLSVIEEHGGPLGLAASPLGYEELKIAEMDIVSAWLEASEVARQIVLAAQDTSASSVDGLMALQPDLLKQLRVANQELKLLRARQAVSDESLALFPDFQARLFVLQRIGYVSRVDRAVQLKGRVACEINTCDELMLTEMILDDVFGPLGPEECASICSTLVMEKRCDDMPALTEGLERAQLQMKAIAERLEVVQKKARVELTEADYSGTVFNFGLAEVVYEWARGMTFRDVCNLTSLEEGSIVRVITRLDETIRECMNAATIIGDAGMLQKFQKASELIKRDIIFVSSLHVQ